MVLGFFLNFLIPFNKEPLDARGATASLFIHSKRDIKYRENKHLTCKISREIIKSCNGKQG